METATFAGGCFWGVESVFQQVPGVLSTRVGYTGGYTQNPSYREVCTHTTGHAEAVELTFDPKVVTYAQLLDVFFKNHNPTQLNRQGPDKGTNYRSGIFTHSDFQEQAAFAAILQLDKSHQFTHFIVTEVLPAGPFWPAEDYHQSYFQKRGIAATCHL